MPVPDPNDARRRAGKPHPASVRPVGRLLPPPPAGPPPQPPAWWSPLPAVGPGLELLDDTAAAPAAATAEEAGFEIVDDDPPPPSPPRRKKITVRVVDDYPARGKKKTERAKDRGEPPPRKKRKGKRRRAYQPVDSEEAAAQADAMVEWGFPIFLMLLGLGMMLFAGFKIGRAQAVEGALTAWAMVAYTLVYAVVKIPFTIVGLMVIGSLIGIEYGTLVNAVRSLAAISLITDGIIWFGSSFGLWGMLVALALSGGVSMALFMILFHLDPWETWISTAGLNMLSYALRFALLLVVAMVVAKRARTDPGWEERGTGDRRAAPPAWRPPGNRWPPPQNHWPPQRGGRPPVHLPGGQQPDPAPDDDGDE